MKALYQFKEEGIDEPLIYFEDFYEFIRERQTPDDKKLHKHNVLREFKGHKEGIKDLTHGKAVTTTSVSKFIFNHFDDYKICTEIGTDISNCFFSEKKRTNTKTLLDLYKSVAEVDLNCFNDPEFRDVYVPTLAINYRSLFIDQEWDKIILFETHYCNYLAKEKDNFETTVKRKWELLDYLKVIYEISKTWTNNTGATIKRRISRQKAFEITQNIEVHGRQSHFPVVIESQLMKNLDLLWPDSVINVACVDTSMSKLSNALTIILSCIEDIEPKDISKHVSRFLNTRHNVNVSKIVFLSQDSLPNYTQENNDTARFHLRDDIFLGKLTESVLHIETPAQVDVLETNTYKCDVCHTTSLPKPLSIKDFSVVQEWYLDVPLDVQILFQTFINKMSFRKSKHNDDLLTTKLDRLYGLYDAMLNTFNRTYIGILQQANTDELAMHFKSITSVFSITNSTGISTSLNQAERKIKERTVNDLCYYNTYLKRYPLRYETQDGELENLVSLQECHLILMMDNLVRLITYSDPNPGENRTGQVCTLPLTLQGLPKDNVITDKWHLENCNKTDRCLCKNATTLTKNDFDLSLISLKPDEKEVWDRFSQVLTWGNISLWKRLRETNLIDIAPKSMTTEEEIVQGEEEEIMDSEENEDNLSDLLVLEPDELDMIQYESTEQETTETMFLEAETSDHEDCTDPEEENLGSLLETANLLSYTSKLLHNEINDHDLSGIYELTMDEEELELSFGNMSLDNQTSKSNNSLTSTDESNVLNLFGFNKFKVPPLLCRHPPPATGRDDDIYKLKEIMDDVIVKTGRINVPHEGVDRILFGPDNKIGANLLEIVKDPRYNHFLPEFPLLHLRKSKINTLFSSYKDTGLLQLLMYMCDEEKKEWPKLISMDHIDVATKYVRRLSLSFHISFMCRFLQSLEPEEALAVIDMLEEGKIEETSRLWSSKFQDFMNTGITQNCTFALHADMMQHCDEVVAVYLSERLGGNTGYNLLLGAVKRSLPFSFLNGASSYGPYCAQLLIQHYSAGHFHQCLKKALYSTPIGNSSVNFACDSKREMDHQDALRGFRSGSSMTSVIGRMSLIDSFNETHQIRSKSHTNSKEDSNVDWALSETDLHHIIPTVALILRRNGLCLEENNYPENVYTSEKLVLSPCVLDNTTSDIGKYLIKRYLANNSFLGMTMDDIPELNETSGPASFVRRVKRSKGVTIKRTAEKVTLQTKTERQVKEENRKALLKREMQRASFLSSEMNMCQALVKPDCTKPKVMKSKGMQQALVNLLQELKCQQNLISLNLKSVPKEITDTVELVTIEFAGVKFKTKVTSGIQYIKYVQNAVIKPILRQFPTAERLILCEEKYSFTPDTFKAATHQQRNLKTKATIAHLRTSHEMINQNQFRKEDIVTTREGKTIMSTYLAANANQLEIGADFILDIDSELNMKVVPCEHSVECICQNYTIPIQCSFKKTCPKPIIQDLNDIHQRKGEAEMSQVDWLCMCKAGLSPSKAACSIVTSGDIDAIPIHMFALSDNWPFAQGKYSHPVFVVLQKPNKKIDVYNIMSLIEFFHSHFEDVDIAKKISIVLCMGGNDFIPKFYGISHQKMLNLFLNNDFFRTNLLQKDNRNIYQIDTPTYKMFMKKLYCPKTMNSESSFDDVRKATMISKHKNQNTDLVYSKSLRSGQLWLPPESAIESIADIINLQIEYLSTAGNPMDLLPNFLGKDCLRKTEDNEVEYYFGPDSKGNVSEIIGQKRRMEDTPQKGRRKKRMTTSTPVKSK